MCVAGGWLGTGRSLWRYLDMVGFLVFQRPLYAVLGARRWRMGARRGSAGMPCRYGGAPGGQVASGMRSGRRCTRRCAWPSGQCMRQDGEKVSSRVSPQEACDPLHAVEGFVSLRTGY